MQSTLDHPRALAALRELQTAADALPAVEVARRARQILDREDLQPFTIVEFLTAEGISGPALVRAAGEFGHLVAVAYRAEHGVEPLRVERYLEHLGQTRRVCEYLEVDRPLIRAVFDRWMGGAR
jgi:hypothetical protein